MASRSAPPQRGSIAHGRQGRLALTAGGKYLVLLIALVVFTGPFLWLFSTALKTPGELTALPVRFLPTRLHWENFTAAFVDDAWEHVVAEPLGHIPLVAERAEPVIVTQTLSPQSVRAMSSGVSIYDLGQNMGGWVRVRLRGPAGTTVRLRFAEVCQRDGTLYTANLRAARQTDTYILRGDDDGETFEPHFTFHGFRYVEVSSDSADLTVLSLQGQVVHSAAPPAGSFTCSHPLLNQLHQNIQWGQRGNFVSVPTNCPQRDERVGWMGDAQIFARTASYNMDVAAFFTQWLDEVAATQTPAGSFANVVPPRHAEDHGTPAWGDAGIIIPWTLYQMYGDTRILQQHYASMARWIAYIHRANPDLIWRNQRGEDFRDWLALSEETPNDVLATAYFAYDAWLMARIAQALDRPADERHYRDLYEAICAAFCAAFVDGEGHVAGQTQTAYVLALFMQLLPAHLGPLAARHLVDALDRTDGHLTTGFVRVGDLCPVLTEAGYPEIAYRLLLNETFPSWLFSIKHGTTTIWERWDGWTVAQGFQDPAMNSFNHFALGSVGQWLYQYMAGIIVDADHPGFRHVILQPFPDQSITFVNAAYQSINGTITSHWWRDAGGFSWRVTIPPNTTATLTIPDATPRSLWEGTIPAHQAEGVTVLEHTTRGTVVAITSGTNLFQSHMHHRAPSEHHLVLSPKQQFTGT